MWALWAFVELCSIWSFASWLAEAGLWFRRKGKLVGLGFWATWAFGCSSICFATLAQLSLHSMLRKLALFVRSYSAHKCAAPLSLRSIVARRTVVLLLGVLYYSARILAAHIYSSLCSSYIVCSSHCRAPIGCPPVFATLIHVSSICFAALID
jgi:hypothetical protein